MEYIKGNTSIGSRFSFHGRAISRPSAKSTDGPRLSSPGRRPRRRRPCLHSQCGGQLQFAAAGWTRRGTLQGVVNRSALRSSIRQSRPHGPPLGSAEKDQAGLHRAVQVLREQINGRIFLGGHSYGGRMATMLCARESSSVDGLLLLSYPLHPPRKPEQLRSAHFPNLHTRALFVHGTRDPFGSIEEMQSALRLIPAETKLMPIEGAGHELLPKKKSDSFFTVLAGSFAQFFR